jgi:hypothetical protein
MQRRQASPKELKRLEDNVAKGRAKDSMKAFAKLTTIVDGEPRITGDPPLIVPIEDVAGDQAHRLEEVNCSLATSLIFPLRVVRSAEP